MVVSSLIADTQLRRGPPATTHDRRTDRSTVGRSRRHYQLAYLALGRYDIGVIRQAVHGQAWTTDRLTDRDGPCVDRTYCVSRPPPLCAVIAFHTSQRHDHRSTTCNKPLCSFSRLARCCRSRVKCTITPGTRRELVNTD